MFADSEPAAVNIFAPDVPMLPVPPVIFIVGAVSSVLPDCEMLLAPLTVKPSVVPAVIVPTARLLPVAATL